MEKKEILPETPEWVLFQDFKEKIKNPFEKGWLIVYSSLNDKDKNQISSSIFSTFIKKNFKEKSLEDYSWDFKYLDGTEYDKEILVPLVFWRDFHGVKENFIEISQDFVHFFNLFQRDKTYFLVDEAGDEIEVIILDENQIKVNISFLFEYMKEKELILSWGFDIIRYHKKSLKEYGVTEENEKKQEDDFIYSFYLRDESFSSFNAKSFSSLLGKKLIEVPLGFNTSYLNPVKKYEKFIIDIDNLGKEISFTCEESKLANYFGANPDSPQFTKSIFFKKEVLDKYYANPSKYSVSDGYLSCSSLWGIAIDNNIPENVAVFLGDLGRLPYKEQKYWRLYNIPKGNISDPFFKRNFLAEFCSPTSPSEYFKEKLIIFNNKWQTKFGWDLFKPLNKEDEHHWKTLRLPSNQKEFDENLLSLTKILIDSLNQIEMKKDLIFDINDKSISILEKYLEQKYKLKSEQMINFIKSLQGLRSECSAHRKASDFSKIYSKFDKGSFSKTFEGILINSIMTLNTIENKILSS